MKVVILAGGYGTRISEESHLKPKPMIEIGGKPILWHIMKIYSSYGYNDFVICLGYKGYVIKEYFANYFLHESDVTFDFRAHNAPVIHTHTAEPWRVTLVDTGLDTMTGGRIRRVASYLDGERFFLTYGDGVADVDIRKLLSFHMAHGKPATVTAIQPSGRFGAMAMDASGMVQSFQEKPKGDGAWVNAGFFIFENSVLQLLKDDQTVLEREPLETLARSQSLVAFKHDRFWQPMDTLRDKNMLDELLREKRAPWVAW